MVVDHKRRVAYCYVPKNSCTTWKAIMANNTGVRSDVPFETLATHGFIHNRLDEFGLSKETYTDKLQTYTKFIVVRHPFDRLLSAYRDKAFPNLLNGKIHGYYYKIKKSVLRRSRHILTAQERQSYVPTFEEFAQHVLVTSNIHWNSYAFRCDPCHINYDYIIRLETLTTDSQLFLGDVYPEVSALPTSNSYRIAQSNKTSNDQSKTLKEFSELRTSTFNKITDKFQGELQLFGYKFNAQTQEAICAMSINASYTCC